MIKNKVAIIGLGYVGLPLAQAISKQHDVVGHDINEKQIAAITEFPTSTDPSIIQGCEFVIVCVPTPIQENKLPNLNPITSATEQVKKYLEKGQTIIIESTINPGVCEEVILPILESNGLKGGIDFELSHCPERINPGDPKWNVNNIPRNIGSLTKAGNKKSADFYRSFLEAEITELSSLKSAEASKVIENTFRDINIAYVNELAKSFDILGIDLLEVIHAASNKPFAFMPHYPSCGVGGHCIPVDPYYLISRAQKAGFEHDFLKQARAVNESMPYYTVELLEKNLQKIGKSISESKIGLLGLAYKADIADLRESPSLKIIEALESKNAEFKVFDPYFPEENTAQSLEELLDFSEAIILATKHQEFQKINPKLLTKHDLKIVIDGQNCLNKEAFIKEGIIYKGIGH